MFALVGPLSGGLLMTSPSLVASVLFSSPIEREMAGGLLEFMQEVGAFFLFVGVFSFIFGGFAALLCGLWVASKTRDNGFVCYRQVVIDGAVCGIVGQLLLSLVLASAGEQSVRPGLFIVIVAVLGAVSAVICLWLCRRMGLVANSRPVTP